MITWKVGLTSICACVLLLALHKSSSLVPALQGQPDVQITVRPPKPAWPEQTFIRPASLVADALSGEVSINTREKSLRIRWAYDGEGDARTFYRESFDLAFWPTAAACITDSRISTGDNFLVAGKRPSNGHTVIERWNVSLSEIPSATAPSTIQRTVIYEGNETGKKVVRKMDPAYGTPGRVFVHFEDSRDIYRFNVTSGELAQVLTSTQVPALAADGLVWFSGGKRADGAFVYIYQCDPAVHQDAVIILTDLQGDGNIDQWSTVTFAQWSAAIQSIQWQQLYDG